MSWLSRIAERLIEEARDAGDLDRLKGAGKPLPASSVDSGLDPIEAAGFRIMKQEGVVPAEVQLRRKLAEDRARLAATTDPEARRAAMAELAATEMRYNMATERRRRF
ncbi:DUF1992 domain-containing protein [Palleronia sediminis]|uniref:DUF1992 domain-containing protein n=1 Tax=Palleronia sediminis TaxID=2547833 RepID=A0A4R6AEM1_9RHOB|nr:DUF1992 domain-containing protein [Palleronia sediminis]TDL81502.1 DUF1992 domain-containing protein [Palleronia sediminis]